MTQTSLPARTEPQLETIAKAEREGYEIYYEDGPATFLTDGGAPDSWGNTAHRVVFIDSLGQRWRAPFEYIVRRDGSIHAPLNVTDSYDLSFQQRLVRAYLALIERIADS